MPGSRTQRLVPFMAGRDVGQRTDSDSVVGATEDYDVAVAVHPYGTGAVALFCDINMEPHTVLQVLAFCRARSPETPPEEPARVEGDVLARALELKGRGNDSFARKQYGEAVSHYSEALSLYGPCGGANGVQREVVKILSNLAECQLKLECWAEAVLAAADALSHEPTHAKSRLRRARAASELGYLQEAAADLHIVLSLAGGDQSHVSAVSALLKQVEQKPGDRLAQAAGTASALRGRLRV